MSHDIACRITAIPPVRTVFRRLQRFRASLLALEVEPVRHSGRCAGNPDSSSLGNVFLYFIVYLQELMRRVVWESRRGSDLNRKLTTVLKWNMPVLAIKNKLAEAPSVQEQGVTQFLDRREFG